MLIQMLNIQMRIQMHLHLLTSLDGIGSKIRYRIYYFVKKIQNRYIRNIFSTKPF